MRMDARTVPAAEPRWRLPEGGLARHIMELLIVVPAYIAYSFVRGTVGGRIGGAYERAAAVIDIERNLGIFWEENLQHFILNRHLLIEIFNSIYIWLHLPVIITVAFWLYFRHRGNYALYRNAFLISGGIGLIVFGLAPLAPPRLMPDFQDIISHSASYYFFQPPSLVNQYAAMPSMHFGWNLLVATAIVRNATHWPARLLAPLMPVAMLMGVVFTANHFFLDAAAGAAVAYAGLLLAMILRRGVGRVEAIAVLA